jgi:threonine aldolase
MNRPDAFTIAQMCDRFLNGRRPATVRESLRDILESPLSLERADIYGKGGVLTDLETEVAELLGKEAAVFMPSGTMAQQIALRIWSDRSGCRRVAFHPTSHLELHEQMAYRELHQLEAVLLGEAERLFTLEDLQAVEGDLSALLIELPQREIGGQLPTWDELSAICHSAKERGTKLHMDGARLWECQPYYARSYAEICAPFDSVYVSFYKVLAGLPGAILAGPADLIEAARVWQRRHGGNLYRLAANAISAKMALADRLPKIPSYVEKAAEIAGVLDQFDRVSVVPAQPRTNMMHLHFSDDRERLLDAAYQIAQENKVALLPYLSPTGQMELAAGDATLELSKSEIVNLFTKLFELAQN